MCCVGYLALAAIGSWATESVYKEITEKSNRATYVHGTWQLEHHTVFARCFKTVKKLDAKPTHFPLSE